MSVRSYLRQIRNNLIGHPLNGRQFVIIIHVAAAPLIFAAVSVLYFRRFTYLSPLKTVASFLGIVLAMDLVVVALLVEKASTCSLARRKLFA